MENGTIHSLLASKQDGFRRLFFYWPLAKHKQYCLTYLLRNIQGLAEHPAITNEEAKNLGELHDEFKALFEDKYQFIRGEISESSWR
jgi:hypothetical protein